jgi:hypothetical protein
VSQTCRLRRTSHRLSICFTEIRDVKNVHIHEDRTVGVTLLFDPKRNLAEKMIQEQFVE